jgi:hypothetical protein
VSFDLVFFNDNIYAVSDLINPLPKAEGNNKEGVLILCTEYTDPTLQAFLAKILQAVNTNISEDVWVMDLKTSEIPKWALLSREIDFKKAIIFGVDAKAMGLLINLPLYQCRLFQDCQILLADGLADINADNNKKKELWRELQGMFSTK